MDVGVGVRGASFPPDHQNERQSKARFQSLLLFRPRVFRGSSRVRWTGDIASVPDCSVELLEWDCQKRRRPAAWKFGPRSWRDATSSLSVCSAISDRPGRWSSSLHLFAQACLPRGVSRKLCVVSGFLRRTGPRTRLPGQATRMSKGAGLQQSFRGVYRNRINPGVD